jgi:hypothetical protein
MEIMLKINLMNLINYHKIALYDIYMSNFVRLIFLFKRIKLFNYLKFLLNEKRK